MAIYLLWGGTSGDGRGTPTYVGLTEDKAKALSHACVQASDPYALGHVDIATETTHKRARIQDLQ